MYSIFKVYILCYQFFNRSIFTLLVILYGFIVDILAFVNFALMVAVHIVSFKSYLSCELKIAKKF
jgi:hypothetical protein